MALNLSHLTDEKLRDPFKSYSPGNEDMDLLSTIFPGLEPTSSTPPNKRSIMKMGDEPEDFLSFLLSS